MLGFSRQDNEKTVKKINYLLKIPTLTMSPMIMPAITIRPERIALVGDAGMAVVAMVGEIVVNGGVRVDVNEDEGSSSTETCFVSPALTLSIMVAGT